MYTHTHTQASAHTSILTMQNFIYTQLKQTTNRDFRRKKTAARNGKHGRSIVLGGKCLEVRFGVQRRFLSERKGKDIPCRGAEDQKQKQKTNKQTKKPREPTVKSLVRGILRLRVLGVGQRERLTTIGMSILHFKHLVF